MYDYNTPAGYGDSFFVYAFQGEDVNLQNGGNYALQQINILDADFVCRLWSGAQLLVLTGATAPSASDVTIQVYDTVKNSWFWLPILSAGLFPPSFAVLPEKGYMVPRAFPFTLTNVLLAVNTNGVNSVYADQMAFYGVRRQLNGKQDPGASTYDYYEEEYAYEITVEISDYGPTVPATGLAVGNTYTIPITDYDFELRRLIYSTALAGTPAALTVIIFGEVFCFTLASIIPDGDSISFAVTGEGTPGLSFGITVTGTAISVQVATDAFGNSTTTIGAMYAALNADPAVTALVTLSALENPASLFNTLYGPNFLAGGGGTGGTSPYRSPFKINLYDSDKYLRSNIPLLAELLCQSYQPEIGGVVTPTNAAYNFFPAPPILYKNDSVIQFDVFSLIPTGDTLPTAVTLTFKGVRRIACR